MRPEFTGRYDIANKEIYESDIISAGIDYGKIGGYCRITGKVVWHGLYCEFGITDGGAWFGLGKCKNPKIITEGTKEL